MKDECGMGLLNIGSCGIHVIHGAFQTGARETGWGIDNLLSSPYYLFKDTSARRDDYVDVTGCKEFPLKFCKHRWVENGPVCSRILLLWPHLKLFVEACESKQKTKPTSNSYKTLRDAMSDKLLSVAKLSFFRSVASAVEPLLSLYQTDKPMGPFLVHDIERVVRNLLERCVKPDALQNASTACDLLKVDIEKERVANKKIEVGFKAESELKRLLKAKAINERQVYQFREECRQFVVKCVGKICERSPLKYSLARNMACLDPRLMVSDQEHSKTKFKRLLENLVTLNRVDGDDVDMLVASYRELLHEVTGCELQSKFKGFTVESDRVDVLLYEYMGQNKTYEKLWSVIRKLLLLSHSQASVERGFSLNRQIEKDNMSEHMLVALRQITDHFVLVGGMLKVEITKELLSSASDYLRHVHHFIHHQASLSFW